MRALQHEHALSPQHGSSPLSGTLVPSPPRLSWTPWQSLRESWSDRALPATPGLYRLRHAGQPQLLYIGQTGRTLRQRLVDLRAVFGAEMPYRDPHTAGPALWAHRQLFSEELEVSVATVEGPDPYRKAVEAYVISEHREGFGRSPALNFGRMPPGYSMSSQRREGVRGQLTTREDANHQAGVPPFGPLASALDEHWCGHVWSPWVASAEVPALLASGEVGLYRIRSGSTGRVLYLGQGRLRSRLGAHFAKPTSHIQGAIFRAEPLLQASWTLVPGLSGHQLLELENDLIASHLLVTATVPAAQFLGDGKGQWPGMPGGQTRHFQQLRD